MSKLDQKPMQQAQLGMSSHNLSHTFDFTSSTGMILPVMFDLLNPGEKISTKVDLSDTRTQPMESAAYLDLDMHVDYFFVPMDLIDGKFGSFIYRINEYYSSSQSSPSNFTPVLLDLDVAKGYIRAQNRQTDPWSIDFDETAKGSLRLFDHLKYGNLSQVGDTRSGGTVNPYNPAIFPWALLAYNACYQYYYLNDEFENFDPQTFNTDLPSNAGNRIDQQYSQVLVSQICSLRFRNKYHDYFTSLKSSPIVSGKNLLDAAGGLSLAKSWLSRDTLNSSISPLVDGNVGASGTSWNSEVVNSPDNPSNSLPSYRTQFGFRLETGSSSAYPALNGADINTANLRALFANEKLWTVTGMNRKQYDAQTLAHFGYNVPTDVLHQVQHLGHHVYNLKVGEVIATAGTAQNPLATVAGKGYGFGNNENKPIKFTAPCHGVFIALYSSSIKRNYYGTFGKENAVATWQDFYQPEFDHLGMQPIFDFEVAQDDLTGSHTVSPSWGKIIGWQYRYEQFKRRYNRSTFAFANYFEGANNVAYAGPFASWSPSDFPLSHEMLLNTMSFNPGTVYWAAIKEDPCELNNMMLVSYDPKWYSGQTGEPLDYLAEPWKAYLTDPLIHHCFIDYSKLSTMSAYSMPRLDA